MSNESIEILVEEASMQHFLEGVLPRILSNRWVLGKNCFIRPHKGKQHLKKSIPRKVRAYKNNYPDSVRLLIIQDQDSNDCKRLKKEIQDIVQKEDPQIPLLVRIACLELENWYLGDFSAIAKVYSRVKPEQYHNKAKFRNPDKLNGAQEMHQLSREFQKGGCARKIGEYIDLENNKSSSFKCFVSGIRAFSA